jgi:hypothetical protein
MIFIILREPLWKVRPFPVPNKFPSPRRQLQQSETFHKLKLLIKSTKSGEVKFQSTQPRRRWFNYCKDLFPIILQSHLFPRVWSVAEEGFIQFDPSRSVRIWCLPSFLYEKPVLGTWTKIKVRTRPSIMLSRFENFLKIERLPCLLCPLHLQEHVQMSISPGFKNFKTRFVKLAPTKSSACQLRTLMLCTAGK